MGPIPSSSGGGSSASSTATSSLGNDVTNYGVFTPAAPPGQTQSWLMPAIIGGAIIIAALLFKRK